MRKLEKIGSDWFRTLEKPGYGLNETQAAEAFKELANKVNEVIDEVNSIRAPRTTGGDGITRDLTINEADPKPFRWFNPMSFAGVTQEEFEKRMKLDEERIARHKAFLKQVDGYRQHFDNPTVLMEENIGTGLSGGKYIPEQDADSELLKMGNEIFMSGKDYAKACGVDMADGDGVFKGEFGDLVLGNKEPEQLQSNYAMLVDHKGQLQEKHQISTTKGPGSHEFEWVSDPHTIFVSSFNEFASLAKPLLENVLKRNKEYLQSPLAVEGTDLRVIKAIFEKYGVTLESEI